MQSRAQQTNIFKVGLTGKIDSAAVEHQIRVAYRPSPIPSTALAGSVLIHNAHNSIRTYEILTFYLVFVPVNEMF